MGDLDVALLRSESVTEGDVRHSVAVGIDQRLVERIGTELVRVCRRERIHVHDQHRPFAVAWLLERVVVSDVDACVHRRRRQAGSIQVVRHLCPPSAGPLRRRAHYDVFAPAAVPVRSITSRSDD